MNPLRYIREQEHITVQQIELELGLHRQTIIRNDWGLYNEPQPDYVDYLSAISGVPHATLVLMYKDWQNDHRYFNRDALSNIPEFEPSNPEHPWVTWRFANNLTRLGFCRAFCLHTSTVTRFENNLCTRVPEDIMNALQHVPNLDTMVTRFEVYVDMLSTPRIAGAADLDARDNYATRP